MQEAVPIRGDRISKAKLRGEQLATGAGPTFGQVRQEWQAARKVRERTAEGYDLNLRLYAAGFELKRIRSIDRAQLILWLGRLRSVKTGQPLAEGTQALILAAVSAVMEYGVSVGYITRNPVKELRGAQRPAGRRAQAHSHPR